jgi:adenylate cyclase
MDIIIKQVYRQQLRQWSVLCLILFPILVQNEATRAVETIYQNFVVEHIFTELHSSTVITAVTSWLDSMMTLLLLIFATSLAYPKISRFAFTKMLVLTFLVFIFQHVSLANGIMLRTITPVCLTWAYFLIAILLHKKHSASMKEQSIAAFERFLAPGTARRLVEKKEINYSMDPRSCVASIMFMDLRGFTSFSGKHPPDETVALLNSLFTNMVHIIFKHGGTLDKFMGDSIMAFWGAPVEDEYHALNAVSAALEMEKDFIEFKEARSLADLDIGIGIHTGTVLAGFMGSEQRFEYTIIGDSVNIASRIEELTKSKARVLVSEATYEICSMHYSFEDFGLWEIKGKDEPIHLYEPKDA